MKDIRLYRGVLAIAIGALALWKGVAAADVTLVDRPEAAAVRGESDAFLTFIPTPQVIVKASCVGKSARVPCNSQPGINNDCVGTCQNNMCVMAAGSTCTFCHVGNAEIRSCVKSAVNNCYSSNLGSVNCGQQTQGAACVTFKTKCANLASCSKNCKDTNLVLGNCPAIRDGCLGNSNP